MTPMTKDDAERFVRSLAPGAPDAAVEWGAGILVTVARARGDRDDVDLSRAWVKALEVSTRPYAATLLAALNAVPPKPDLLPEGWQAAA